MRVIPLTLKEANMLALGSPQKSFWRQRWAKRLERKKLVVRIAVEIHEAIIARLPLVERCMQTRLFV